MQHAYSIMHIYATTHIHTMHTNTTYAIHMIHIKQKTFYLSSYMTLLRLLIGSYSFNARELQGLRCPERGWHLGK